MPSINPVGASSKVNMMIHADIGVGKTSFIGTGGKDYKILLIRPPIDHTDPIIGSGVQETIVRDWEEIFETLEYVRHEGHEWDWCWLDSISLLQDVGLDDVYTGVLDKKGPPGSQARKDREQFGPDRGEYRVNMWRLAQYIRHIVGAGVVNLGITAHSFWYEPNNPLDELTIPALYPWIQGKNMPSKISGMMNIVAFMDTRERERNGRKMTQRVMHTNKSERYYAKCQFKLPDGKSPFGDGDLINPTLPKMMEALAPARPARNGQPIARRRRRRKEEPSRQQ
jgi:hypothetical protein